jgi:hypothetical protein
LKLYIVYVFFFFKIGNKICFVFVQSGPSLTTHGSVDKKKSAYNRDFWFIWVRSLSTHRSLGFVECLKELYNHSVAVYCLADDSTKKERKWNCAVVSKSFSTCMMGRVLAAKHCNYCKRRWVSASVAAVAAAALLQPYY